MAGRAAWIDQGRMMHWFPAAGQRVREHLRRWWKIDVLTLGVGGFLAILAFRRYPTSADFWDALITNFASELIGVWLGARIIGFLLANQEEFNRVRRNVLNVIESCSELSRKTLIKYDVVFLEEFQSRRSVADRIYRNKRRMFSEDELEQFGEWIEAGDVFEIDGRLYFQQISDLRKAQFALQDCLSEHLDRLDTGTPDLAATLVPCSRLLDEPWCLRITNGVEDFVHNFGNIPDRTAAQLRQVIGVARGKIAGNRDEVRQGFEAWFAEIDQLLDLRNKFDYSFRKFNRISEKLTTNILEQTEE